MTLLAKQYTQSLAGIKTLLKPQWQVERQQCHKKLLALQADVGDLLKRGNFQSAKAQCARFLCEFPGERAGYKVLARVLEAVGDHTTAAQCFGARLPIGKQNELFGTELQTINSAAESVRTLAGHSEEHCDVQSSWSEHSIALQQFQREKLLARKTQTLIVDQGFVWHDGLNSVPFERHRQPIMEAVSGCVAPITVNIASRRPLNVKGDVVLLGAPGTNNYFHWMTDILPKLAVLERCGVSWNRNTHFVFRNVSKSFQMHTLQLLGINRSQWIQTLKGHEYIRADRIIVPQLQNKMCLDMGMWVPDFLQRSFLSPRIGTMDCRKLFVSRDPATAQGRDIGNVNEVGEFFRARGYEIFYPEQHSIEEQASAFASATHIAAPHGAGLANLHFCSPGTRVWEFHGAHFSPCYWALCEKLGLIYRNLDCSAAPQPDHTGLDAAKTLDTRRAEGFSIPVDRLHDLIT